MHVLLADIRSYYESLDLEGASLILYSSLDHKSVRDLDLCMIVHNQELGWERLLEGLISLSSKYSLVLDHEVPYNSKLVYRYADIENIIKEPPFLRLKNRYIIQPIEPTPAYLSSQEMRDRLLVNILTTKATVWGSEKVIAGYRARVWEMLLPILYSHVGNYYYSIDELLDFLCRDPVSGSAYKMWLGYDEEDIENLGFMREHIQRLFQRLLSDNDIEMNRGKYRYTQEYLWERLTRTEPEILRSSIISTSQVALNDTANGVTPPSISFIRKYDSLYPALVNYPDHRYEWITERLSKFLRVSQENVLVVPGSLEPIYYLPRILDHTNPILFVPTFWAYLESLKSMNIPLEVMPMSVEDHESNLAGIRAAAKRASLVYICNPNKFTTQLIGREIMLELVCDNPNCHFIVDETYILFSDAFDFWTVSDYVESTSNLSIVYSISKFFNLSGARIGACVLNKILLERYKNEFAVPYRIANMAQLALNALLRDEEYIGRTRKQVQANVRYLLAELSTIPALTVFANPLLPFLICRVNGMAATDLYNQLKRENISIKDLTGYLEVMKGEWVRIGVGDQSANRILVNALRRTLG